MESNKAYSNRIIVFTGAGASAALGLPTTPEFVNQLKEQLPNGKLLLRAYMTNVSQVKQITTGEVLTDSEYVRDWLENLKMMARSIEELSPVMRELNPTKAPTPSNVVAPVDNLLAQFDSLITKTYGKQPKPKLAYEHYSPLLDILKQDHGIEVVP
ncbi:hypothetical protein ACFLXE_07010 [Chloroflexota bacterium]